MFCFSPIQSDIPVSFLIKSLARFRGFWYIGNFFCWT